MLRGSAPKDGEQTEPLDRLKSHNDRIPVRETDPGGLFLHREYSFDRDAAARRPFF